ncbi:MAG: SDR family oxidoreductase [Bacteroidetes bacterium]|nr:MAG: SDR family oxidoreductase [Bacteroidota bacterium]TAG86192.1 MAG: SDR family oxidoreductase [Bacteroidota bacterium]
MQKKILITGANGLLGQKLVHLLTQKENQNFSILATAKGENRLTKAKNFEYMSMNITDENNIKEVINAFQPHVIIHTAAMTQVDDCESQKELCWELNVKAVEYLSNICAKNNIFFIHLSTDFIFDGTTGPLSEDAIPNPISFYGESKLAAENIVLQTKNLRYAIARTVLVYGITEAMSRTNIILWVKKSLEDSKTIQVVDDQWRTPTLAEDLAMGCFLLAQKEKEGIFNISGYEMLTPYQMAMITADYFQLDTKFIVKSDSTKFTQPAKRPPKTGFLIEKARKELGFEPHSFLEGIKILESQM